MARRSSATRRMRREKMAEAEAQNTHQSDKIFDNFVQCLNIVDVKRRSIQGGKRRLPWAVLGVVVASLILAICVLSTSIIFIFLGIALFSGAVSQLYGPVGILTRRSQARVDIVNALNKAGGLYPKIDVVGRLNVFGIKSLSKKGIEVTAPVEVTNALLNQFSEEGALGSGQYKYLGVALKRSDGQYDISYRTLEQFSWIYAARTKGVALPKLTQQLNEAAA